MYLVSAFIFVGNAQSTQPVHQLPFRIDKLLLPNNQTLPIAISMDVSYEEGFIQVRLNATQKMNLTWFYLRIKGPEMTVLDQIVFDDQYKWKYYEQAFEIQVQIGGIYRMEIFIERTEYNMHNDETWTKGQCFAFHDNPVLSEFNFMINAVDINTNSKQSCHKVASNFTHFLSLVNNGRFVKKDQMSLPHLNYDWMPYDCTMDEDWIESSKRVLIMGDCTTMDLALGAMVIANSNINLNEICKNIQFKHREKIQFFKKSGNTGVIRAFDTNCSKSTKWNIRSVWNGGVIPPDDHQGLKVLQNEGWLSGLENIEPELVFVNFGLHDLDRSDFTFDKYEKELIALKLLLHNQFGSNATVVFLETNPKFGKQQCVGQYGHGHRHGGNPAINELNRIARKVFGEYVIQKISL